MHFIEIDLIRIILDLMENLNYNYLIRKSESELRFDGEVYFFFGALYVGF